jgi:hypothetical protein
MVGLLEGGPHYYRESPWLDVRIKWVVIEIGDRKKGTRGSKIKRKMW